MAPSAAVTDGETTYTPVYSYTVDGREYRFNSSVRSSGRPTIGQPVDIMYSASIPENAHRTDGIDGYFPLIFFGAGALVFLLSLFSLLISLALIVFGIYLFIRGCRDRRDAGATPSHHPARGLVPGHGANRSAALVGWWPVDGAPAPRLRDVGAGVPNYRAGAPA